MKKRNLTFLMIVLISSAYPVNLVGAQSDITFEETYEQSDNSSIENTEITSEESTEELIQPAAFISDFKAYIPFINFINYQYEGDGSLYATQDIIMEYTPDSDGIFQIAAFSGNNATAYVFQVTESGLYELAEFKDYNIVEDLRYTAVASDANKSLILPSQMTVGDSFNSGYSNEKVRTVTDVLDSYSIGGMTFNQVLVIEESSVGTNETYHYYYAPSYGLILIERVDIDGGSTKIVQLISTAGTIK